ncbi:hypothetical protein EK904_014023 [Melospiza melodia maxima]|nr:hypothetical protein EK904_014023 [Melospiza melodia maxima]
MTHPHFVCVCDGNDAAAAGGARGVCTECVNILFKNSLLKAFHASLFVGGAQTPPQLVLGSEGFNQVHSIPGMEQDGSIQPAHPPPVWRSGLSLRHPQ